MGAPLGRVFKIRDFSCMIFDRFIKIFHAPTSPLTGRVFKIRQIFPRHFMSNKWHFMRQPHPVRGDIW